MTRKKSANVGEIEKWIEELKKRGISEFQFRDLPEDLKKIGMIRRASVLKKITELKKIKDVIVWKVE
jgi:thiamine monophosphate synthase